MPGAGQFTEAHYFSTKHVHSWTPIPLECGKYECACGATSYRELVKMGGGVGPRIFEHRQRYSVTSSVTAQLAERLERGDE